MTFLIALIRKDLLRWKRDRLAIILWLGIPLMIGGLITSLFEGNNGAKPQGVLLIADLDNSLLSGLISGAYSQGQLGEMILVEKTSVEEGESRINAGEASGFLVIPAGFSAAFLDAEPVTLELKTNPSQIILPGIITDVTEILLDAGFYARQLFGAEIDQIVEYGLTGQTDDQLVATIAVAMQNKIETAAPMLFPPAIDLDIAEPPDHTPQVPFALLFLPGMIMMALMFSANGLAGDYWVERERGTLRRLVSSPRHPLHFIAGKAVAAGLVIAFIGFITLVIGFLYHGIAWSRLPSSLFWIALSGIALFAWFGALQMMTQSRRAGNLLTSMLLFPLLMAGGSFFPFAALPEWIANIGRLTPNGFIVDRLTTEFISITAWSIDLQSWLILGLIAASGLAICAWRLGSGFARG